SVEDASRWNDFRRTARRIGLPRLLSGRGRRHIWRLADAGRDRPAGRDDTRSGRTRGCGGSCGIGQGGRRTARGGVGSAPAGSAPDPRRPAACGTEGAAAVSDGAAQPSQRLDKWLWIARFFKTRSLSAAVCVKGRIRVNRVVVEKAHYAVRPGDVLTFPQADRVRVVRITGIGARRGPASEAR